MKLQVTSFDIEIRVANYEWNLEMIFSKKFDESNFQTARC